MILDKIFDSLVANAFDFLNRGVVEFDNAPKYSVVHFCAAVEMFLKARLMREHWSLIVSKPDQANLAKFMAGDFISVTLDEARARLRDIAEEPIDSDAFDSFVKLARHRNKMVHFFHADVDDDGEAKAKIVAEHCRSWFHLHRLLKRWDEHFSKFQDQISEADRAMKKHGKYLDAKFKALKTTLNEHVTGGRQPRACCACGFMAAIPHSLSDEVATTACLVCDHLDVQVQMECPHCNGELEISSEGYSRCPECGNSIEPTDIVDVLTDSDSTYRAMKDGDGGSDPANCGACDGYHTVVEIGDQYLCACCFDISDNVQKCDYCGEYNTGDMEHSYANGCEHCEGQWGHMKGD